MTGAFEKAFKVLKNHQLPLPDEVPFRRNEVGPYNKGGTLSTGALAAGHPPPQQFPESGPMPNSKEVQEMLLQMAQEKLQNPTYMQNMMEILQKPEGEDFARAAGREYENSYNEDVN